MQIVRITGDLPDINTDTKHIESCVSAILTLCGFCDVSGAVYEEGVPDCPLCLQVVKHCQKMKIPK